MAEGQTSAEFADARAACQSQFLTIEKLALADGVSKTDIDQGLGGMVTEILETPPERLREGLSEQGMAGSPPELRNLADCVWRRRVARVAGAPLIVANTPPPAMAAAPADGSAAGCISQSPNLDSRGWAYLVNTCSHTVRFAFCAVNPKPGFNSGLATCSPMVLGFFPWHMPPHGAFTIADPKTFNSWTVFSCMDPMAPQEVRWIDGGLKGRCVDPSKP